MVRFKIYITISLIRTQSIDYRLPRVKKNVSYLMREISLLVSNKKCYNLYYLRLIKYVRAAR